MSQSGRRQAQFVRKLILAICVFVVGILFLGYFVGDILWPGYHATPDMSRSSVHQQIGFYR